MVLRFPEASKKPRAAHLRVSSVPQPCHKRATSVSQACHHSPSSVSQLTAGLLYGDGGMRGALRIIEVGNYEPAAVGIWASGMGDG